MTRGRVTDFELANRIYASATVTFSEPDSGGPSSTLIPLYAGLTGSTQLGNPQRLDSNGHFVQPVYFEDAYVATVSGVSVGTHNLGVEEPPTFDLQNVTSPVLGTLTALRALSGVALAGAAFVLGFAVAGDLGGGAYFWNASDTRTDDGGAIVRPNSLPATGRWNYKMSDRIPAGLYGVKGDRTTDDLAAFNAAVAGAHTLARTLFVQPLPPGYYYKLSNTLAITSKNTFTLEGAGNASLFVIANNAGANCITLSATIHARIRNIGIYGTSGSGNGIELTNASHYNEFEDIWIGWVDGDGIKVTEGISNKFTDISVDEDIGYRPATLVGGLTDGTTNRCFYVASHLNGLNNNQSFINCHANGVGSTMSLQVGDTGLTRVASFSWVGGLIQGSTSHRLVYLVTQDGIIEDAHIEPPVGATANWGVTMDACVNTVIRNGVIADDVRLINGCVSSGIEHARLNGVDIDTTSDLCFLRDCIYANNNTGPATGAIKNKGTNTELRFLFNASNARVSVGNSLRNPSTYIQSNMEHWVGGAGASVPCGFAVFGGTVTRESTAAHVRSGTYSASVTHVGSFTEGFQIALAPTNAMLGRKIHVQAELKNITTPGLGYIELVEGGTGATVEQASYQSGVFEEMSVTFKPDSAATSVIIRFTGIAGTVKWDNIKIEIEEHYPIQQLTLDDTGTPSVSYGGYAVQNCVTSGTTPITTFLNPHVGVEITVTLGAATDFTDSASLQLPGSADWTTGVAGDVAKFMYGNDGVWRCTGRSVN